MKDNTQMLPRGVACIVIGIVVLLAPQFLQSPAYREMIGGAYLVGWFAIVLGVALVAVALFKRSKGR
ncbi:hypothetical protein QTI66_33410 [Variovorax sp. J22R133]|uniref:hypothetical protein n=1 Tax=Variovorax brevis TaxID=3053503 RepID=UPI002575F1E2|nr:hypothetical protein [Variovorax sp. J22R133]MDM0117024.1 hypothetical protein [Variovorax sp. J22R133]